VSKLEKETWEGRKRKKRKDKRNNPDVLFLLLVMSCGELQKKKKKWKKKKRGVMNKEGNETLTSLPARPGEKRRGEREALPLSISLPTEGNHKKGRT